MHLDRHTGRRTKKSSKHKHSDNNSSGKAGKIWNKKKRIWFPVSARGGRNVEVSNSIQKPSATPTSLSSEFWNRKTKNLLVREMQELNTTKKTRKLWGTIKSIQVEGRGHRTACSKEVWHKILLFFLLLILSFFFGGKSIIPHFCSSFQQWREGPTMECVVNVESNQPKRGKSNVWLCEMNEN